MRDASLTYFTGALWVTLFVAYAIRIRKFGAYKNERVLGVGGTVMVGEDIMHATYWAIGPIVRGLVRLGVTPNMVTFAALGLGLAAGVAIAFGAFGAACLLATLSTIGDILDGQIARATKSGSTAGELLDAIVDRYTEFAFIAGFVVYAHESPAQIGVALAALLASFMISYASAKAEALQVATPRGLMRRHERAVYLILTAGLTPVFGPALSAEWPSLPPTSVFLLGLAIVGAIGNVAAIQRMVRIRRAIAR
jgi:CDP-diacylglycerol--glycerol-3-phosphate 3-phosphatidyltransferase